MQNEEDAGQMPEKMKGLLLLFLMALPAFVLKQALPVMPDVEQTQIALGYTEDVMALLRQFAGDQPGKKPACPSMWSGLGDSRKDEPTSLRLSSLQGNEL